MPLHVVQAILLSDFFHMLSLALDVASGCHDAAVRPWPQCPWPPAPYYAASRCLAVRVREHRPVSPAFKYAGVRRLASNQTCARVVRQSERELSAQRGLQQLTRASTAQAAAAARHTLRRAACLGDGASNLLLAVVQSHNCSDKSCHAQSLALLLRAVLLGSSLALHTLAFRLQHGIGLEVDLEAAFALYSHAGRQALEDGSVLKGSGHMTADVKLEHTTDVDVGVDSYRMQWLHSQARAGNAPAQLEVALAYLDGNAGVEPNMPAAVRFMQHAAAQLNVDALYMMGIMHRNGHGVPKNQTVMREYFEQAAMLGHVGAINGLGAYWTDVGRNSTLAAEYFLMASVLGSGDGSYNYAHHLKNNATKNLAKVAEYFLKSARTGHAFAELAVAKVYLNGGGLPRNVSRAVYFARKVAQRGFALGNIVHDSVRAFVADNLSTASLQQMLLAEAGLLSAQENLAWLAGGARAAVEIDGVWVHALGGGVAVLRAWELAAYSSPRATCQLAHWHWYGRSRVLPANVTRALQLYDRAAAQGDPEALFNLGVIAEFEMSLPPNVTKARWTLRRGKAMACYARCAGHLPCALALWKLRVAGWLGAEWGEVIGDFVVWLGRILGLGV